MMDNMDSQYPLEKTDKGEMYVHRQNLKPLVFSTCI
jgi:hypothetical protein